MIFLQWSPISLVGGRVEIEEENFTDKGLPVSYDGPTSLQMQQWSLLFLGMLVATSWL